MAKTILAEDDSAATASIHKPTGATGTAYAAGYSTVTNQVSSLSPLPTYDANGNQLTSTPATLTWNALNLPISVNSTTATYDALGRMVEKGSGGTYTQFVFSPAGAILAEYSGGLVKGTIPLPGGGTAIYNGSGLSYIRHTDYLGSSRLATTWAHAVYSKEAYAPFGETYYEAGTADRSFTGQDQDVATGPGGTGVYDFLFRKYDPSAGRWLSPDPYGWGAVKQGYPQSLNRYAYVENQPMNLVDPYGMDDDCTMVSSESYCITMNGWAPYSSDQAPLVQEVSFDTPPGYLPPYGPPANGGGGNNGGGGGNSGGGGNGGAPNNGDGGMNGVSPLYPYGHDILVIPIPTCKGMDTTGDIVGGAGAVGTIGFGIASLTSAGAASPITVPGLTVSGIGWASGNLLNILAKHGIGCTGSL